MNINITIAAAQGFAIVTDDQTDEIELFVAESVCSQNADLLPHVFCVADKIFNDAMDLRSHIIRTLSEHNKEVINGH